MAEKLLMKGNEALAEAAIRVGCRLFFGYPITPQTEISAYMAKRMPKVGGLYLQAESEIAAVNMVIGAASTGARAMTSSSSPGISLKAEGISYMAGMDLPAVIVDIMRAGPGLGGIQPSQSDYWQVTHAMGHGDFHLLVFAPSTVQEMVNVMSLAFDKAEEYRMPAMILGDGILGQMMEPVEFPEEGAAVMHEKPWAACGTEGQRKKNIINSLFLQPDALEIENMKRFERYRLIEEREQRAEEYLVDDADVVVVAYGATARVARNAIRAARAKGIKAGMIRPISLWPFPKDVIRNAAGHASAFVCAEHSMGQMIDDVRLAINCAKPVSLVNRVGGIVLTPAEVLSAIEKAAGGAE